MNEQHCSRSFIKSRVRVRIEERESTGIERERGSCRESEGGRERGVLGGESGGGN